MMKKNSAVLLAGMMAVSLAACGESSEAPAENSAAATAAVAAATAAETSADETTAAADTTAAAAVTTADADAAAPTVDLSADPYAGDGVLTVGLNATFPPFEYVGDDGNPTGFDVAMMQEIGSRLGLTVEIEDMDFDGIVGAIGNKIDVAATGMTITDERKEAVNFSDPYYDATQSVLLPADSAAASKEDLAGLTVGVQAGTTGEMVAEGVEGIGEIVSVKSFNQAVLDLVNGKNDAVIIDAVPAKAFLSQYPDALKIVDGETMGFDVEQYGIAMPKDDAELGDAINSTLKAMKDDGTYDALVEQWINNYEAE